MKGMGLQNLHDIAKSVINLRYYKLKILCYLQILKNIKIRLNRTKSLRMVN